MSNDEVIPQSEESLVRYLEGGGKVGSPINATPRYRAEVMRLMAVFVDSELAGGSGFADCINLAPGVKERVVASRMVLEKFSNAEKVLRVMEGFGSNTNQYVTAHPWASRLDRSTDLGTRRIGGDMRLNVFHYPIYGWCDSVVLNVLMGRATLVQLDDLSLGSYEPFADALMEIIPVERRHAEYGEHGVKKALADGYDPVAAQASINYWYPRVAATFGRSQSEHAVDYRKYGLRQRSNEALLSVWGNDIADLLRQWNLQGPTL